MPSSPSESRVQIVDGSRGTVLWGFNRFRSDALVQLLNDLLDLERDGLPDSKCELVRTALSRIPRAIAAIPNKSWLKSFVCRDLEEFEALYSVWNSHGGDGAATKRNDTLREMHRRRLKLTRKVRSKQLILSTELDARVIGEIYLALEDLSSSMPAVFKRLSLAVNRYNRVVE